MTILYLIRHGEISRPPKTVFIGGQDLPLTDQGRLQMARLADMLAGDSIERVACSPLCRSCESADILCSRIGGAPEVMPDLREICLGAWEGLGIDQVRQRFPGGYEARGKDMAGYRPEGGESFNDLYARVWPCFEEVKKRGHEKIAIVAHAGVNRVILCHLLHLPLANVLRISQPYGCLTRIDSCRSGYCVDAVHLASPFLF